MIELDLTVPYRYTEEDLCRAVCAAYPTVREEILSLRLHRRTLKVGGDGVFYAVTVAVALSPERERGLLKMKKRVREHPDFSWQLPHVTTTCRPVVVGAGPAGLFCALALAEAGIPPLVLERGLDVDARAVAIRRFYQTGQVDPACNIQFGEGGAGAFSDGKLKAGKHDAYKQKVLAEFVLGGAPESVLYDTEAHVGTDRLPGVVRALRQRLLALGTLIRYSARLTDFTVREGKIAAVTFCTPGGTEEVSADALFLATGHSARDVFRLLEHKGIPLTPRPFGIGVRIEHPRRAVNAWRYGIGASDDLPTASYHLVTHLPGGRSVYSFCMCPGGSVVAATSAPGAVVTNGMSNYARDGENSNAAFLVSVTPEDFPVPGALGGLALQEQIESAAYRAGGSSMRAPVQRMEDFLACRTSTAFGAVLPTYPLGTAFAPTDSYLPAPLCEALRAAIPDFEAWQPGFYDPDALLTGAETRSTSPVRVERDEHTRTSPAARGLYPVGEGAGYAGGIVSSAIDGLKSAESYINLLFANKNKK